METVSVLERRALSEAVFELQLSRPSGFAFTAGQWLRLSYRGTTRSYSMVSGPDEPFLTLCIEHVPGGGLSPALASIDVGTRVGIDGPHGYFTFLESSWRSFFVATGTGIAPFASMARSGVQGFTLLHGSREREQFYYASLFRNHPCTYIPCLSSGEAPEGGFSGRVTHWLEQHLAPGAYAFYLCGHHEMIREATLLVDERFPGSVVRIESYS